MGTHPLLRNINHNYRILLVLIVYLNHRNQTVRWIGGFLLAKISSSPCADIREKIDKTLNQSNQLNINSARNSNWKSDDTLGSDILTWMSQTMIVNKESIRLIAEASPADQKIAAMSRWREWRGKCFPTVMFFVPSALSYQGRPNAPYT